MAKSKNRKDHKKKVAARNQRLVHEKNQMEKQMEELQKLYVEEMAKKAKEDELDSGEVPLKL
jgi:tyrosyl-tRNA synthetase|tara:strand:+ start:1454 stop:1639 length:186 start_codon:yes stop_codon:yes gene_type:complete